MSVTTVDIDQFLIIECMGAYNNPFGYYTIMLPKINIIKEIFNLPRIEHINLHNISNKIPPLIKNLKNLKTVYIYKSNIYSVQELSSCPKIEYINAYRCDNLNIQTFSYTSVTEVNGIISKNIIYNVNNNRITFYN